MLEIDSARAYSLPDGSYLKIRSSDGEIATGTPRVWKSLDISIVLPSGFETVLCAVDYESGRGLDTIVYDKDGADPVFVHYNGKFDGSGE